MSEQEVEAKFDVGADDELPSFDDLVAGPAERRDLVLTAIYWDTADHRLAAWGCSLRHRTSSDGLEAGWTLKIPAVRTEADAVVRHEVTSDGPPQTPPDELLGLVRTVLLGEAPRPVATVTTHRATLDLVGVDGVASVQVADDRVESQVDGGVGPAFRQVEVEIVGSGSRRLFGEVSGRLLGAGFSRSGSRSKIRRVLGSRPSLLEAPKRLPDDATVLEFLVATVGSSVRQLMVNDPGVRLGVDVEALHQARVATRRLRSDLKTFAPMFGEGAVDHVRDELAWLGGLMGEVRDPQVLRARLAEQAAALDDAEPIGAPQFDAAAIAELTDVLDERAAFHHVQLMSAMDGDRYRGLVADLVGMANDPPVASRKLAKESAAPVARRLARKQWKRAERFIGRLGPEPDDLELHDVRKRLKRARYAAQSVKRIGAGAKDFRRELADLQDRLGDHHDLVVQRAFLAVDVGRLGPDAAFLAGRLLQEADHHRREMRADWPGIADRLDRLELD